MAFWQQKVLERVGSERLRAGVCRLSQQRKAASSMAPRSPLEQINGSRPAGGCCPFPGTTAEERRQAREAPDNANAPRATSRREGGLTEAGGGPPSENGQDARVSRAISCYASAPPNQSRPEGGAWAFKAHLGCACEGPKPAVAMDGTAGFAATRQRSAQ